MEYEPILPPELPIQPEIDTELDPKSKKKKKKIGEWLTQTAPREEEAPKTELTSITKVAEIDPAPSQPEKTWEETAEESRTEPEGTIELSAEGALAEELPGEHGPETAKILRFPRDPTRAGGLDTLTEMPSAELLSRSESPVNLSPQQAETEPAGPKPENQDDEPTSSGKITAGGGGGSGVPPAKPPVSGGGGLPPTRSFTLTSFKSPNILRTPERVIDNSRAETVGTFILGVMTGGLYEHFKHRRREKRAARKAAKQQAAAQEKVESLETRLIQAENKKRMPEKTPPTRPEVVSPAAPPPAETRPQVMAQPEIASNPASTETLRAAMPDEAAPATQETVGNQTLETPESKTFDLKTAALKEDASIITADVVASPIERDIERNSMATFGIGDTVEPPKKLVYRQTAVAGAGLIAFVILGLIVLWLLEII